MKVLAVINAYNEADCIGNAVSSLIEAGAWAHVFDHGSTDGTYDALRPFLDHPRFSTSFVSRSEVPAKVNGRQSAGIWQLVGKFVRARVGEYNWVIWQAADELIRQPNGELITVSAIEHEASRGIEVIRPLIRNFSLHEDDSDDSNYLVRLRHYMTLPDGHAPRAWRIDLTPEQITIGLHIQDPAIKPKTYDFYGLWPEGTKVSNNEWLLDHYPLRSIEQARRKVFEERNWIGPTGTPRYAPARKRLKAGRLPIQKTFLKRMEEALPMPAGTIA